MAMSPFIQYYRNNPQLDAFALSLMVGQFIGSRHMSENQFASILFTDLNSHFPG
jgi:hypothetical protein